MGEVRCRGYNGVACACDDELEGVESIHVSRTSNSLWHARSRLVLIHFECELDAIIHVRREAISDAKDSLR
eukprot:2190949-Prymnesium_polylepis.3